MWKIILYIRFCRSIFLPDPNSNFNEDSLDRTVSNSWEKHFSVNKKTANRVSTLVFIYLLYKEVELKLRKKIEEDCYGCYMEFANQLGHDCMYPWDNNDFSDIISKHLATCLYELDWNCLSKKYSEQFQLTNNFIQHYKFMPSFWRSRNMFRKLSLDLETMHNYLCDNECEYSLVMKQILNVICYKKSIALDLFCYVWFFFNIIPIQDYYTCT